MKTSSYRISTPLIAVLITLLTLFCALVLFVRCDIKGHFDGIFILKERNGWRYELKDDLYVGDGDRIVYALDFEDPLFNLTNSLKQYKPGEAHLHTEWDERDGSGFFMNTLPNGTRLFTGFGRLFDEDHQRIQGLFVGGALPASVLGGDNAYMNESGMAFNDGRRWYHIWCNVNEAIAPIPASTPLSPSHWHFLGSKILDRSDTSVVVMSSHQIELNGNPLRMDRYVYLTAGETFFHLTVKFTNTGSQPTSFIYFYGDEPWLGNYGSSAGNVGWVRDEILPYEAAIDTKKYSYAGFFHYGNSAIGEDHNFSMMSNFIEWPHDDPPFAYFSNKGGLLQDETGDKKIPLASNERFIGLQWEHQRLLPGQTVAHSLAIGMGTFDPKTGLPTKPKTDLH